MSATGPDFAVVIPTIGRPTLQRLLAALERDLVNTPGVTPQAVIIVDDRAEAVPPLLITSELPITVVRSGGRGPAAARNAGWRRADARWICFLDDDVRPDPGWAAALAEDLAAADATGAVGSQAIIGVPVRPGRRVSDDERRTQRLETAQWITADMAYRRSALVEVGGFDERFPRAYREDSDLGLRITLSGKAIVQGGRRSTHPVARARWASSVRAQVGNRDDALLHRKYGKGWRPAIGEGRGRLSAHIATTVAACTALAARDRQVSRWGRIAWCALTADFALRRFLSGRRTVGEAARMLVTSILIPPVAVYHRLRGEWDHRAARRDPPLAVLLDRDDTIIEDVPYLNDPGGVVPVAGADDALNSLRANGILLAVVTNQSGVAKGLIDTDQLAEVNARVDELLGPFDTWQICVHDAGDGCECRKPRPGMVLAAAEALGVPPDRCVLIGDTGGDVQAALAARARAVLVPTGKTLPHEVSHARERARVASTLTEAVAMVLKEAR
ncbi:HAD-IIIA family hydrolase [Mycolicibacterium smegmatis]|uniref:D,D-heptose 1,7-bisphosphate phosphatase n=1 Tax=Mycolicibacterium smegmatis (strain MKD8) TaxID=1214915 RepID=A0A2U9PLY8_MYCSE|nr:HAD-IIIA family hydrolase [Mycolicibacterium smegmatis]AWT52770.1 putative membrane sugar transferase [Mycolicibacterium smegmatis MKD8]